MRTHRLIWLTTVLLSAHISTSAAPRLVVIGDSLSAEYETIPDFPGTENPTEYARITVDGWESMSWVEVLGRLRPQHFDLGGFRTELLGWLDLRFSGYQFNFAIPGFRAAQYEDIVNSSLLSNPQFLLFRSTLADALENSERAVIWLGANEFRANFGALARGGDPAPLISKLIGDLEEVIEFVQKENSNLQLVIANLPDLSAAPDKRNSHPDPVERARVTAATKVANDAIAALAKRKSIAVADVFSQSERLLAGITTYFGAVSIIDDVHPDNHPRFHFTRDGLHPNTPSQIEIARAMIDSFNEGYNTAIPQITDSEALELLKIDPRQPYFDWMAQYRTSQNQMTDDPDADGLANIVELAFGLNPIAPSIPPVTHHLEPSGLLIRFRPAPEFRRLVIVNLQTSTDLIHWTDLNISQITVHEDGSRSATIPITRDHQFVRVNVGLVE